MDDLLSQYTYAELIAELERGHYWYFGGDFYSDDERDELLRENPYDDLSSRFVSVESAVYFRETNNIDI